MSGIWPIYTLALCSGFAALVYQVVWARMLGLAFGSTALSTAAVVAGFMGGMGLGAALYRHFSRPGAPWPLKSYVILELGIAISAALLTVVLQAAPDALATLSTVTGSGLLYQLARIVIAFALLLVPSLFMGATFPALCTVLIHSARGLDRHLGAIYGINTLGAAIGVLVAGLYLVDRIGLTGASMIAVLINLTIAAVALALVRSGREDVAENLTAAAELTIPTTLPRRLTGVVLLVSGMCTLGYEILWFRALQYTVGTSTYAFAAVLFTFLIGLGFGSLALPWVAVRRQPERYLFGCQLAISALALVAAGVLWAIPEWQSLFEQLSIRSAFVKSRPWLWRLTIDVAMAMAIMLPAALCMGLSFPLAARLFAGDVRRLDSRIGSAYALANAGGIIGAIGGALILMPVLGTIGGTKVLAAANLVLAAALFVALKFRSHEGHGAVGDAGSSVNVKFAVPGLVAAVLLFSLPVDAPMRSEKLREGNAGETVFSEEGDLATVQVLRDPDDPATQAMTLNGIKIGWSNGFAGSSQYRKQLLLAHLPLLSDRTIRHTLNVGLGSGATLEAISSYPRVETLDVVEISASVARACRFFSECGVLEDERARLAVDDVLHFLRLSGRQYDLIVSDGKQHPMHSANAVMLCREYYEFARQRLSAGGMMVQWLPLAMLHEDLRIVLRTIGGVFDNVELFFFPPASVVVMASPASLINRIPMAAAEFAQSRAASDLSIYRLNEVAALLGHRVASREQLMQVVGDGPVSTWNRLILDSSPFTAAPGAWQRSAFDNLSLLERAHELARAGRGIPIADPQVGRYLVSQRLLRRAMLLAAGDRVEATRLARQAQQLNPADGEVELFLRGLRP